MTHHWSFVPANASSYLNASLIDYPPTVTLYTQDVTLEGSVQISLLSFIEELSYINSYTFTVNILPP